MKAHLRTLVVFALAILLLVLFFRDTPLADVVAEIRRGRLDLLLAAFVTTMATYALRAFRWQYLLSALGPTRFGTAFRTTVIGFAASFLLPARAGEFLRPYLLAREEHLNATSAFATVILERVLDTVTVLVFFGVFLLVFDPRQSPVDLALFRALQTGGLLAGGVSLAILGIFFVLAGHPEALGRMALGVERVLPARIAHTISGLVRTFAVGLGAVRQPGRLVMTFVLSFPLWLSIAAGIFLVTRAFHIDQMPPTGTFVIMTLLVIGVAVPTPGAVGGFHYFYKLAVTSFYGVKGPEAAAAALVLHAISFVPVTLLGIAFMARMGLSLGGARTLAKETGGQKQEETP
jgi:hypothetical protein